MKFILAGLLLFVLATSFTEGLSCYKCKDATSVEECLINGVIQQCDKNEDACQNEVRIQATHRGLFYRINKGCKQAQACRNNQVQNYARTSRRMQCVTNLDGLLGESKCTCCCQRDLCNPGYLYCMGEPRKIQTQPSVVTEEAEEVDGEEEVVEVVTEVGGDNATAEVVVDEATETVVEVTEEEEGVEESTEEVESVEEKVAEEVTDVVEETAPVVDEAGDEVSDGAVDDDDDEEFMDIEPLFGWKK